MVDPVIGWNVEAAEVRVLTTWVVCCTVPIHGMIDSTIEPDVNPDVSTDADTLILSLVAVLIDCLL